MLSKALLGFSVPDKQPSMTAQYNKAVQKTIDVCMWDISTYNPWFLALRLDPWRSLGCGGCGAMVPRAAAGPARSADADFESPAASRGWVEEVLEPPTTARPTPPLLLAWIGQ